MAYLLAICGGIAGVPRGMGNYRMMAYSVSQRRHEFRDRMALGASAQDVIRARHAAETAVGLAVGILVSGVLSRLMSSARGFITNLDTRAADPAHLQWWRYWASITADTRSPSRVWIQLARPRRSCCCLLMGAGSLMGSFSTCMKHKQTWEQLGNNCAQTPGKTGEQGRPKSRTNQQHRRPGPVCKTSIPGSNPGGASTLRA